MLDDLFETLTLLLRFIWELKWYFVILFVFLYWLKEDEI